MNHISSCHIASTKRRDGREDVKAGFAEMNLLPIPWVDPVDISNAIVWLASDAARHVTGITLPGRRGQPPQVSASVS
jgi:NAD(P)-dependent dehydrogenase (short-subunit alcohol dehydrogenase family)